MDRFEERKQDAKEAYIHTKETYTQKRRIHIRDVYTFEERKQDAKDGPASRRTLGEIDAKDAQMRRAYIQKRCIHTQKRCMYTQLRRMYTQKRRSVPQDGGISGRCVYPRLFFCVYTSLLYIHTSHLCVYTPLSWSRRDETRRQRCHRRCPFVVLNVDI